MNLDFFLFSPATEALFPKKLEFSKESVRSFELGKVMRGLINLVLSKSEE